MIKWEIVVTYKHIVFDWDGTLADTYPVISAAYDYTFDKMELPRISYDEVKRITSTLQNKDTLGHVFGQRRDEAAKYFYEYVENCHTEKLEAMPKAKELLQYIYDKGLNCYLITNKKTKFVTKEIEKLGFSKFFQKIVAAGEYAEDKPHPIACNALFDNHLPPAEEIVMIGDGEADIKTTRNYDHDGATATAIIYDPHNKYGGSKPEYLVADLYDIVKILERK